ncbi:S-adenosyl methyltransferase [Tamaricihabitans halophyticus]|uniref:S-adenosyl methyltransferase n=1 Tax=Tamaricihabitans halophyticus TaxID=1262583 RepID=A0A4R2R4Q4_9PSEU|nr:SAM-dependent methyltransferase [Tamaricihabitans halophyticus]TCP56904.1 S-adenosyl methyltransferase [Tamaricihabitans halophyticus]
MASTWAPNQDGPDHPHNAPEPSFARINDYWLDGSDHTEADVEIATRITMCAPHIPYLVRELRHLLGRMVRELHGLGIRQFLDLGSGIPNVQHIHQVVAELSADCRVVYVDSDPDVASRSQATLRDVPFARFISTDIRQPAEVLADPQLREILDLSEPVAVFLLGTLQEIADEDDPRQLVADYFARLSQGSYLALSHFGKGDQQLASGLDMFGRMFQQPPPVRMRDTDELRAILGDLSVVEPGIVRMPLWHPSDDQDMGQNAEHVPVHVALGVKNQ